MTSPVDAGRRPLRRTLRVILRRHRRSVAAVCAAGSVLAGLNAVAPPAPDTLAVVTSARDLAAGTVLAEADLRVVRLPRELVPRAVLTDPAEVVGRGLAGAVRGGEALTDVRLTGAGLLAGLPPGLVAVPLRVGDAGALTLVQPGDRVDVHAVAVTNTAGAAAEVADLVVDDLLVVNVTVADRPLDDGGLLVVAAARDTARLLLRAAAAARFSISVRGPR